MSAFDLRDKKYNDNYAFATSNDCEKTGGHGKHEPVHCEDGATTSSRRVKDECIVTLKVYDSCRQQDCCTPFELGPARAAQTKVIGGITIHEGEIIDPPPEAAAVTVEDVRISKVVIVSKEPSPFKAGFWDIELKYIFVYNVIFRDVDGCAFDCIAGTSIFNKKLTLFGSTGSDLSISTDLFGSDNPNLCCGGGTSTMLSDAPFVMVEAKAVPLSSGLKYSCAKECCDCCGDTRANEYSRIEANEVLVTLGVFSIVKVLRLVTLSVESKGFCIPKECEDVSPLNPCDFFESLDFPMDIFAPPQKPEFFAGISSNIPSCTKGERVYDDDCGCDD